jgi:RimJ/RimL family protein N-acetyltransferase
MVQMDGKRARAVVAEFDEQVTAFALLTFWREVGEIGDLIVAEKQRSIGIGSAMIAHLIGAARGRGITRIEIGAAASNPRALALYKRLGFIAHRKIELDLGAGNEPVVYLHMNLTGDARAGGAVCVGCALFDPVVMRGHGCLCHTRGRETVSLRTLHRLS